jgi:hypothetical protein
VQDPSRAASQREGGARTGFGRSPLSGTRDDRLSPVATNVFPNNALTDGVAKNDKEFLPSCPYLADP